MSEENGVVVDSGVTVDAFNRGVGTSLKQTMVNILEKAFGKHGVSEIKSSVSYAVAHTVADSLSDDYKELSDMDTDFIDYLEDYSLGKERAKLILDSAKFELEKEHDMTKATLRVRK